MELRRKLRERDQNAYARAYTAVTQPGECNKRKTTWTGARARDRETAALSDDGTLFHSQSSALVFMNGFTQTVHIDLIEVCRCVCVCEWLVGGSSCSPPGSGLSGYGSARDGMQRNKMINALFFFFVFLLI